MGKCLVVGSSMGEIRKEWGNVLGCGGGKGRCGKMCWGCGEGWEVCWGAEKYGEV